MLVDPFEIAQTLSPSFFVLVSQENRCNAFKCDRWRGNAGRLTYWGFLDLQLKAMAMFITVCSCVHYQKPEGGDTFLKFCIGCIQQPGGQTWNGGAQISHGGTGHHWPLRWRRAWCSLLCVRVFITVCSCVHYSTLKKAELDKLRNLPASSSSIAPCLKVTAAAIYIPTVKAERPNTSWSWK